MAANFTLSFRGTDLRKHRRQILFEREKSFLPSMQVYVEAKKEMAAATVETERLNKSYRGTGSISERFWEYIQLLNATRGQYAARKMQVVNQKTVIQRIIDNKTGEPKDAVDAKLEEKYATLAQLRSSRETLKQEMENLKNTHAPLVAEHTEIELAINTANARYRDAYELYSGTTNTVKREFIMKCGAEECRGFLSTAYKCGVCDVWTCPDCLVVLGKDKTVEHTCKPDMVESAKAIKAETQPCPKCAARIFKVDGCDQMWCTMEGCNTAFSWKTGHVVTGVVHNPHYYEWLRRNGGEGPAREAGDIPCGGIPNYWTLLQAFRVARILPTESVQLELVHRNLIEFGERLVAFPARMPQLLNKEVNVEYLMNNITEAEWKRQLEFTEAKFNRKKEIGQILQTLVTAGADIMNQVANRCQAATDRNLQIALRMWLTDTVLPELEGLRVYTNQAFKDLAVRNHMAVPQIGDDWQWMPIRALYRKKKAPEAEAPDADAPAPFESEPPPLYMDI
jgi:hypothetical protein